MEFIRKPLTVQAVQWLRPGDHPAVVEAGGICLLDSALGRFRVQPFDYIVAEGSGYVVMRPDVFESLHSPA